MHILRCRPVKHSLIFNAGTRRTADLDCKAVFCNDLLSKLKHTARAFDDM